MVQPFIAASGNRIEVKSYIPREQLIYELSKMDFLVNFTNGTSVQTPSKLIDYAITGRPILNVDKGNLNTDRVNEFLEGTYTNRLEIGDISAYHIKNVAQQFIALADEKPQ